MKVLSILHYPFYGGPHNQVLRLARPLEKLGWESVAVLPTEPGPAASRLIDGGVSVLRIRLGRLRATRRPDVHLGAVREFALDVSRLRSVIAAEAPDVVMLHGLVNPHGAVAARLEGRPVVWQLLDTRAPKLVRGVLTPVVAGLAGSVMTTGTHVAALHPGLRRFGPAIIPYFPPVDTDDFRPDDCRRSAARQALGVPDDAILIGTLGNLTRQKGHQHLIRAAGRLVPSHPSVYFRLLGATFHTQLDYAADLRREATELGLTAGRKLEFFDPHDRAAQLLPAFDIFVVTSEPRSEGIPTALLEAMSCGLPTVATSVGGISDAVLDGQTGILVPPMAPTELDGALSGLLVNTGMRRTLGAAARILAVDRYDLLSCAQAHVQAMEEALATQDGSLRRKRGSPQQADPGAR